MRLMAHSNDMRFQCYVLEGQEDADIFDLGAHRNQKEFHIASQCLSDDEERYFVLWDAKSKSIVGKGIIWFRPNLAPRFTGLEISTFERGQRLSQYLHQASIRYMQELGTEKLIEANIDKDKIAAFKAAQRHGYQIKNGDTGSYYALSRAIEIAQPNAALDRARSEILDTPQARLDCYA